MSCHLVACAASSKYINVVFNIPRGTATVTLYVSFLISYAVLGKTRSSADANNGLDAFSGQSRLTNMVPFWVHCDFSLSMRSASRTTDSLRHFHSSSVL